MGKIRKANIEINYEAIIHSDQLKHSSLFHCLRPGDEVYLSLPKEKDMNIIRCLKEKGARLIFLILEGKRGWLDYADNSIKKDCDKVISLDFDDEEKLKKIIETGSPQKFFLGTQSFIRLLKQAML